jgi:hypothetical protein
MSRASRDDTTPGPAERQTGETAVAFEAFRTYLEMGPSRSLAKVGRALGKSKTLMDRWSKRHAWQTRVAAFEAVATRAADDAHMDAIARRSKRQAEVAQLHGEASLTVAREVLRRLADPEAAAVALEKVPLDELLRISASMGRMHNRAVVTERLALGLTTDQAGEPMPRAQAEEVARRMSDDELDASLSGVDELAAAREKRRARREAS